MEWTHTSANLQHAKTTARREQSRESDAPEKHWGLGENGGDAVARQTLPPPRRSLHLTSEEYTSRGACTSVAAGDIGLAPGPRKPPASLARPLLGGDLAQPATNREGAPKGQRNALAPGGRRGRRSVGVRTIHPPTPVGRRRSRRGRRSRRPAGTTATHLLRAAPLWRSA